MPALNLDGAVGAKERRPSLLDPEALRTRRYTHPAGEHDLARASLKATENLLPRKDDTEVRGSRRASTDAVGGLSRRASLQGEVRGANEPQSAREMRRGSLQHLASTDVSPAAQKQEERDRRMSLMLENAEVFRPSKDR